MLMGIELGMAVIIVVMAFACPRLGSSWFASVERGFKALAHRRRFSLLAVAVISVAARTAVLPILPEPKPYINDEFSHLLAADTFAHGRITNPPHPLWIHFETFHVIQQPTYASIFPPAQGLALAFGQATTGHPFVGVVLSVALLCAVLCWMLQGWFSPPWALLGGLLAIMHFGVFSYWANSYWGGSLAAIGGALVIGALPRIRNSQRRLDAVLMGVGMAILANSRPYEGFVLCLPVAAALVVWMLRGPRPPLRRLMARVLTPLLLVLILGASLTCYYFSRVTGSPFLMPYQVNERTYRVAPYFIWQSPRPEPLYHHLVMRDFHKYNELDFYNRNRSMSGIIANTGAKLAHLWMFYLGPLLTLPLVMVIGTLPMGFSWTRITPSTRFLLAVAGTSFIGVAGEVLFFPHYAAPIACIIWALSLVAMRRLYKWPSNGRPVGQFLVRALPLGCGLLLVLRAVAVPLHLPITPKWPMTWYNWTNRPTDRARLIAQLDSQPGEQLVIVRYAPHFKALPLGVPEWVYNRADIDNAKVVWAQDMGAARNQEIIDYYKGRQVWLVEPDRDFAKWGLYRGDTKK